MSNYKNFFNLNDTQQLAILDELHNTQLQSVAQIADKLESYPNKVRRLGTKLGFQFRDKSASQKVALQTGAISHPTKGKKRTKEEKLAISEKMAVYWANLSDEDLEARADLARENWEKLTDSQKAAIQKLAVRGRLDAAQNGSKLEKLILELLISNDYKVKFHVEHTLLNEKFHLDLLLPEYKTAIEIDGPTHFEPIWGNEAFQKKQDADNRKDGLLLNAGYYVVRVRQEKNLSQKLVREISERLLETLEKIKAKDQQKRFVI